MSLSQPTFYSPATIYYQGLTGPAVPSVIPWVSSFDQVPSGTTLCVLTTDLRSSVAGLYALITVPAGAGSATQWKLGLLFSDITTISANQEVMNVILNATTNQSYGSGNTVWRNANLQGTASITSPATNDIWIVAHLPSTGSGTSTLVGATDYVTANIATGNLSISNAIATVTSAAAAAQSTANTASTNASSAVSTASTANTNATSALTTAGAASTTANTALTNAAAAITTANAASTLASTANANATAAQSTANTASTNASSALTLATAALPSSQKGAANGLATLGSDTKVPTSQMTGKLASTDLTDGATLNTAITNATNAATTATTTATGAASTATTALTTASGKPSLGTYVGTTLGTAAIGASGFAADALHVHPMPSALDTGAIPAVKGTWNASTNQAYDASNNLLGALATNTIPTSGWPIAYRVSVAGTTSINGITNWQVNDVIYQTNPAWARSPYLATVVTTAGLIGGDNAGGTRAAVAGVDYSAIPLLQRGAPIGVTGQFTFGANGAVTMGYTPGGNTLTLDNTGSSGLTGRTATLAVATLAGTSADNGKVITLDNGKTFTITTFSSTTVATGTLSAIVSSVTQPIWYLNSQMMGGVLGTNGLTFSATSGSGVTATAAVATFTSTALDVGKVIVVDGGKLFTVTAFTSTTVVVGTISGGTLSTTTFAAGSWVYGWTLNWSFNTVFYGDGLWLYYPANSISSSNAAGFYWTVMTNGMVGTVYNLTYTPGVTLSTVPTSGAISGAAFSGAAGTAQFNAANVEYTIETATVPASYMGKNGRILINHYMRNDVSSSSKSLRVYYSTYQAYTLNPSTNSETSNQSSLLWRGRTNSQIVYPTSDITSATANTQPGTIDSTLAQNLQTRILLTAQVGWAVSEYASVIAYPGA
jgi:hypothetical protein